MLNVTQSKEKGPQNKKTTRVTLLSRVGFVVGKNRDGLVHRRVFLFRIPSTICFGQGASRGFKSTKKRKEHQ